MFITEFALLFGLGLSAVPDPETIRTRARDTLEPLCRGRCDVVDVEVKTRAALPQGAVAPGFDEGVPGTTEVSEVRLILLFDRALPPDLRRFAMGRVKDSVGEIARPVRITPRLRSFPIPAEPLEPETPPRREAPPSPPPTPREQVAEAPAKAKGQAEAEWVELAYRRALETLPILFLFVLLAWVVLRVMRRMEDLVFDLRQPQESGPAPKVLTPEVVETSAPTARALPPPETADLTEALQRHRSSTRRVFRRLLLAGEHETVARAVALLGDGVVRDLAHDPDVKPALLDAGLRTAEVLRNPMTDDERDELLRGVQAELVADRVAHRGEDIRPELEPLLGWSPEAFVRFVRDFGDKRLAHLILRHAPIHLTEAYLRGLDDSRRSDLVQDMVEAEGGTPAELETISDRVRTQSEVAEVGGREADHVVNLLDALSSEAQDSLLHRLEQVQPDFVRRNAGRLPTESSLLRVPDVALTTAWSQVPLETWVAYLRSASAEIRGRALDACPARVRTTVTEELSLRIAVDADAARAARRSVVQATLSAAANAPEEAVGLLPTPDQLRVKRA